MEQLVISVARVRWQDGVVVLAVSGELDVFTGEGLDRRLASLISDGHNRVALDVAGLCFCDAFGLGVLVRASARAEAQSGWVRLVGAVPRLRRLVAITRLTRVLPMFATLGHALQPAVTSGDAGGPFGPGAPGPKVPPAAV